MAINPDDLQKRLCDQLCAAVRVDRRPDGELMLEAGFEFPDGDRYTIHLSEVPGGVRLTDMGDTLMRIGYDHDIDAFVAGSRGLLVERILGEERVGRDGGVFYVDAPIDGLAEALFRYGRALTRIYDLALDGRSEATSSRYDDQLAEAPPIPADECPRVPKKPGLYMFTEGDRVMWVGKATNLRQRIEHHTHYHHKGRHRTTSLLASTLANNMAARTTGRRKDAGDPLFRQAVLDAAARIRERMEVRWVLVDDPNARSLCERAAIDRYRPEYNSRR